MTQINYLGGRPKGIAQSIIFSMYGAMFQIQSKALYEKIAEVRGVLFRVCILLAADFDGLKRDRNVL